MKITEFEMNAVKIALKKMFDGNHFSICTIDQCLKVTGCIPPKRDYEALNTLHCVHWSEMDKDFRDQVFAKILSLFAHEGFDTNQLYLEVGEQICGYLN